METSKPPTFQGDLPLELWTSVISSCDRATCKSLSLVSETFRQRSQLVLFTSIVITFRPNENDPTLMSDHILERLEFLQSPAIATAIHSCTFSSAWESVEGLRILTPPPPAVLEPCFAALLKFTNMQSLDLRAINVNTAIVKNLTALHPLERITIGLGDVVDIIPDTFPRITTRRLTVFALRSAAAYELWISIVDLSQLESFTFYVSRYLRTKPLLPTQQLLPKLLSLRIKFNPSACWTEFCQFMSNCPLLEDFQLRITYGVGLEHKGLFSISLPSLRSYSGPAGPIDLFMPERVVPHLHLHTHYTPCAFANLTNRTPHLLQSVQLSIDFQFLADFLEEISRFPCLRALALQVYYYGDTDTYFVRRLIISQWIVLVLT